LRAGHHAQFRLLALLPINGCTWGGRAIHSELVAARGLFLEFGNQVVTTRILKVQLLRKFEPRPASLN
jgi:hypothetical protein